MKLSNLLPEPPLPIQSDATSGKFLQSDGLDAQWADLNISLESLGAEPVGTASLSVSAHEAASNPHPQYTTNEQVSIAIINNDEPIRFFNQIISKNTTIPNSTNGLSVSPVGIAEGIDVNISENSVWGIV